MSGNSTPDTLPNILQESCNRLFALDEDSIATISKTTAHCPKCSQQASFKNAGRGGTISANGIVPTQLECLSCKRKTSLRVFLEANAERQPIDDAMEDGTGTPFLELLQKYNSSRKTHATIFQENRVSKANHKATKQRKGPIPPPITDFFAPKSAKRIRIETDSDDEAPIIVPGPASAPASVEAFVALENATHNLEIIPNQPDHIPQDRSDRTELDVARARIAELEEENNSLKAELADFRKTYSSNLETINERLRTLEGGLKVNPTAGLASNTGQQATGRRIPGLAPITATPATGVRPDNNTQEVQAVPVEQWSTVVSKQTRRHNKNFRRKVAQAFKPRGDPIEFTKIHIPIPSNSSLKACPPREKRRWLRQATKFMDIHKSVFEVSKIGNSIMEIYVPDHALDEVASKLEARGIERVNLQVDKTPEFARQGSQEAIQKATVNRLANLFRNAKLLRLKDCILRGYSQETQEAVKSQAALPVQSANPVSPALDGVAEGNSL
jgi:hypothetical protein